MPRVVVYQGRPAGRIPERHLARIVGARPDFLCLPEYFWTPPGAREHREALGQVEPARRALADLSRDLDCAVIGGSYLVEHGSCLYNTAPVFDRGTLVGEQRKVNPTARERARGVACGDGFAALAAGGLRLGVLICADVLEGSAFAAMRGLGVDVIFAPTLSPYRPGEPSADKERRDREIFAAGAVTAGAPVVKACGIGRIFGSRLQGRSLVAAADGRLVARVPFDREGRVAILAINV